MVVEHFISHRMPAENITISKFIETVKGRRSGDANPVANTLENRRAMQKAMAADAEKEEEEEEEVGDAIYWGRGGGREGGGGSGSGREGGT